MLLIVSWSAINNGGAIKNGTALQVLINPRTLTDYALWQGSRLVRRGNMNIWLEMVSRLGLEPRALAGKV